MMLVLVLNGLTLIVLSAGSSTSSAMIALLLCKEHAVLCGHMSHHTRLGYNVPMSCVLRAPATRRPDIVTGDKQHSTLGAVQGHWLL
jgi:hypothetical protein